MEAACCFSRASIVADNEIETFEDSLSESDLNADSSPESTSFASTDAVLGSSSFNAESDPTQSDATDLATNGLANIEARLATLSDQLSEIQGVVASKDQEIAAPKLNWQSVRKRHHQRPPRDTRRASGGRVRSWWRNLGLLIAALAAVAYIARRRFSAGREGPALPSQRLPMKRTHWMICYPYRRKRVYEST